MSIPACYKCAYRADVAGSAHSACRFDFAGQTLPPPMGNPHAIRTGWWVFPFNFDPVCMLGACLAWAETADPAKMRADDSPLEAILGILGRRMR